MIQREIDADGKNLCRINGRPVTVSQLRTLGANLLNIHGQHDGQQLLDEEQHGAYLDRFGRLENALIEYHGAYDAMHRLSLNPLRHIDWLGLLMMFAVGFGWAKPVPVDPRYFKDPKKGMALTALAGPVSNFMPSELGTEPTRTGTMYGWTVCRFVKRRTKPIFC